MPSRRTLSLVAILLLAAGCSCDRKPAPVVPRAGSEAPQSPSQPGSAADGKGSLRIEPAEIYRGTPVRVSQDVSLQGGAAVEWLVNGQLARGGGGSALDMLQLRKGDTIQARIVGVGGTALSQVLTVRNSPPEMRGVRFVLGDGGPGSSLGVEAEAYDADGDSVRIEIEWRKNGEPAGAGNRLGIPARKGDKIHVTLTPSDGEERGKSASLSREIRNTNPMIEGQEQFQVSGNVVTFHVRASDGDGDSLTYSIKDAPAGMLIDGTSGWVRWETAAGTTGKVPFSVTVSDGSGGETTARFTVTISEQPPSGTR
jgi:hypothetical protein